MYIRWYYSIVNILGVILVLWLYRWWHSYKREAEGSSAMKSTASSGSANKRKVYIRMCLCVYILEKKCLRKQIWQNIKNGECT